MQVKAFCISFELKKNNSKKMHQWLAAHEAKECGADVAFIARYEFDNMFEQELMHDLELMTDELERAYVICSDGRGDVSGKFIIGSRKESSWEQEK